MCLEGYHAGKLRSRPVWAELLARGFFHEANEPLAVERRGHAAQLAVDPAYPLVPRLRVLHCGVHLCRFRKGEQSLPYTARVAEFAMSRQPSRQECSLPHAQTHDIDVRSEQQLARFAVQLKRPGLHASNAGNRAFDITCVLHYDVAMQQASRSCSSTFNVANTHEFARQTPQPAASHPTRAQAEAHSHNPKNQPRTPCRWAKRPT